jgi:hypothetical protein
MITENALITSDMTHSGVLDSGCSSHTLDVRAIPDSVNIDGTKCNEIKTARAGETMSTLGRANAGLLKISLVLKPGELNQNLVSLPRLDNSGHITILGNGEGLAYKDAKITISGGTLVARAPLNAVSNLYELGNIQELIAPAEEEQAMFASVPVKNTVTLWHKRLGHRSKRSIIRYRNMGRIKGLSESVKLTQKDQGICESCARAKSTRHSFNKKRKVKASSSANSKKKKDKLISEKIDSSHISDSDSDNFDEVVNQPLISSVAKILAEAKPLRKIIPKISTDIKGPISVEGRNGERYYQGFIEADTKYQSDYNSIFKSNAPSHTDFHWNTVLKAEGSVATVYQADGAPERVLHLRLSNQGDVVAALHCRIERSHYAQPQD